MDATANMSLSSVTGAHKQTLECNLLKLLWDNFEQHLVEEDFPSEEVLMLEEVYPVKYHIKGLCNGIIMLLVSMGKA